MALIPNFEAIPNSGVAPMMVMFTDLSSETPDTWEWDFGDGSANSSVMAPVHLYNTAGTYTITLTVTKGLEVYTKTVSDYITVTLKANFYVDFPSGLPGLITHFVDISTGNPTSWEWDFGDGSPISTERNPYHEYRTTGKFTVSLKVFSNSFLDTEIREKCIYVYDSTIALEVYNGGGFNRLKGPSLIFD
jgi:PKD repeat protein